MISRPYHCWYLSQVGNLFCVGQTDQLAEMISSVFMLHSGSNLQTFKHLNVSAVVMAAELSIHSFFEQVKAYIKGTVELVTTLPSELAAFPGQVFPSRLQLTSIFKCSHAE